MMGLLNDILSTVDNAKRNLSTNFFDAITNPKEWGNMMASRMRENMYGGPEEAAAMKGYLSRQPYDAQAYAKANDTLRNNAINESLGAITVWHGSPHKFDKFDMSKIGTGEGAQAYGHGIYAAEAPEVAKTYKFAGDATKELTYGGKPITDELKQSAAYLLHLNNYDKEAAKAVYTGKTGDKLAKIIDKMDAGKIGGGNLYKVDIPDEAVARFLDWDKPLSQQAPEVLDAIKKSSAKYGPVRGNEPIYSDAAAPYMRGQDFYRDVANALSESGVRRGSTALSGQDLIAANHLKELGIPGIRYLDGGSRGQQAGTSNFVLFDDQMPRILEINGTPTGLQPWKPGEWRGLLGE